jgi:DNA polymerase-3 subunit epsilon
MKWLKTMQNEETKWVPLDYESMASTLEATDQYRVLRRLATRAIFEEYDGSVTRSGLFVDVETTGLDPSRDEIVELAMVPFTYGMDGRIFHVDPTFEKLREPGQPLSARITALTGITTGMVAGKTIDPIEVSVFVNRADLVIAHNASFDRRFLERFCDAFAHKPWACSMSQIDWSEEGFEGTKLGYLAMGAGFFYDRHRAANDCLAAIELLAMSLPKSGQPAMYRLLERARQSSWRIYAENSPFELRNKLKARGYRWNGDGSPNPKAWYIDVDDNTKEQELAFLQSEIYQRDIELLSRRITAYDRFSDRI